LLDGDDVRKIRLFYKNLQGTYYIDEDYRIDDGDDINIGEAGGILMAYGYATLEAVADGTQLRREPVLTEELQDRVIVTPRDFNNFLDYLKRFEGLEDDFDYSGTF
jgi:hypothetical protein